MNLEKKKQVLTRRRFRIRKKVLGTAERPRLCLTMSNSHIYAQCIDDVAGKTLFALSSMSKDLKDKKLRPNVAGATELGKLFGQGAKKASIDKVIFDRNTRTFTGAVKAFAEAARESLTF